ncbi:primase C-terminal domain-containing protein [Lactiplantibacillus plantarum]|nr:primase C-terminal domain-containing protein [Lactiplantibacillus plantarum]
MILYRGYLRGDGKHASSKFKNGQKLLKFETVRKEPSYVGILADDFICVDVDTQDDSRKLLKILDELNFSYSALKTNHGVHFYFQGYDLTTNKIGWYTAIGIKADFKLGIKNTADPLRIDGETRKWLRKTSQHDSLPKWLLPLNNHRNHIDELSQGERNQKLFNYILVLQRAGMSRDEIRQTIKLINNYVLDDPLPQREVNVILRNDAFLKETFFGSKGAFLHDKFAKFLIAEHHIILVAGVLHIYKDGVYSDDQADIERAMIKHIPGLTSARRIEVIRYLQLQAEEKPLSDVRYIALKNGLFNLENWKLQEFSPTIVIKNKIPVNYVQDAYFEPTDRTLNKIAVNDKQLRFILEEIFGYVLFRRNELGKAFILTGDGSNGKSSYLKIVRRLVGSENTSSLDLKELGQRFKTAELFGKLANIGDDISNEYIKDNSEFKKLTTGETINAERKGRDPFDFNNYAKLIFSANKMPRINDTSNGLTRRLMFIPFNAHFTPADADYDPFITDKLLSEESMQYVLLLGLNGLKRLLKNHKFATSKKIIAEAAKYEELNNPLISYLREEQPKLVNEIAKDAYIVYSVWCSDNGYKPISQIAFSREVCRMKKLKTKTQRMDGKRKQIFINPDSG